MMRNISVRFLSAIVSQNGGVASRLSPAQWVACRACSDLKNVPTATVVDTPKLDESTVKDAVDKQIQRRDPIFLDRSQFFDEYPPRSLSDPREVWIESLQDETGPKDLMRVHPDVFGVKPRLDILWQNIDWQLRYRVVRHDVQKDRYEMHYGGRPWPQKGTGRARHASRLSPLWYQGGKCHPNRGLRGNYFMLPVNLRIHGLVQALSAKMAQDDVRVVKDLHIDTKDPNYIENLIDERCWGISALMVDVSDIFPENIAVATETIQHVNLMPCYGLNVHSILKHKTLVLTVDAVNYLEEKILFAANRLDFADKEIKCSTTGFAQT